MALTAAHSPPQEPDAASELTIGDLASRTGVPVATLRTWESRHGAPRPTRRGSGHRRFTESDVDLVAEISRLRASGLALSVAIAHATKGGDATDSSVFHTVSSRHPHLNAQVLHKRTLVALTQAIEDECCMRARRPLLFAGFQRERYYRQSYDRWQEMARTADEAVVFAAFGDHSDVGERPVRVALPESAPLRREWLVVCDDPDYPACVIGAERPGQSPDNDLDRRFEAIWSVDPQVVRDAARVCATIAGSLLPEGVLRVGDRLAGPVPAASADLGRAHRMLERVVKYLDSV